MVLLLVSCPVLATNCKQKIEVSKRKKKQAYIKVVAVKMKNEIRSDTREPRVIFFPRHDVLRNGPPQREFGCRLGIRRTRDWRFVCWGCYPSW